MKRSPIFVTICAVVLYLGGTAVFAQHGHGQGVGHTNMGHGASTSHGSKSGQDLGGKKTLNERLSHNSRLSSKLQSLLPPNTTLQNASTGFKNMGQFVAALHVSHNLNIPFDQLKGKMTGKPPISLGKAIHELDPHVDSKAESKKATHQAEKDISESKVETEEAKELDEQKESRS